MTPVDVIQICNSALAVIGAEGNITSLNDSTKPARLCSRFYDQSRQSALTLHPWKFAAARTVLTDLDSPGPSFGFNFSYPLPDDCLSVRLVNDHDTKWEVEGRSILCDSYGVNSSTGEITGIDLYYTKDEQNYFLFHPLFVDVLALFLANKICYQLTQSDSRTESVAKQLALMTPKARFKDAIQNSPKEIIADEYINVRIGPNRGFVRDPMT